MNNLNKISLLTSRKGLPCLWETGGADKKGGSARLIGDISGKMKQALYEGRGNEHALVRVEEADAIVDVERVEGDIRVVVHRINQIIQNSGEEKTYGTRINNDCTELAKAVAEKCAKYKKQSIIEGSITFNNQGPVLEITYEYQKQTAVTEIVGHYKSGQWEIVPNEIYSKIISIAIAKSNIVNCKESLYTIPPVTPKRLRLEDFNE